MKILCIGDSLTYGYDVPVGQRWTSIVARNLGVTIVNEGICGDTTQGMAYRLEFLKLSEYDAFFFMGGSNDVLMDTPLDEITARIKHIVGILAHEGKPLFIGIPPVTQPESAYYGWQQASDVARHNDMLQEIGAFVQLLCKETGAHPIDYNEALQHDGSLYADGVHPNVAGYAKIAALVQDAFQSVLSL